MLRLLLNGRLWFAVAVVGALLAVAMWPDTASVETTVVTAGPLLVTVDEGGRTRVRQRYVVSAPLTGRVLRIDLEPGDTVKAGAVVARVRAEAPPLLDARTRAEAQAAADGARAVLGRARAEEQRARTALAQAERELARTKALMVGGAVAQNELDLRQDTVRTADEAVKVATFAVTAAASDVERAEVRLRPAGVDTTGRVVNIVAPVAGVVLRRLRESESVVPAGEPLLEIGDPRQLEIVSDLLSTDAVRVKPGARALVDQWGGTSMLEATVRRVEPSGFTKVSALGVEEQRVNVVLDFKDAAEAWAALGDAYRVEVRVVVWEAERVLKVPTGALFRDGARWAVYVVEGGLAKLTHVELGQQTGEEAEVRSGLAEGAQVVMHPGDTLTDGARVEVRSTASTL
ncbi:MAG TPA: efflux RND transporter periplasmic adaptor subunit [Vicinamibacterales bacterium]